MTVIHARPGAPLYGAHVGILHVPSGIPFPAGAVGHAATYGFPVLALPVDADDGLDPTDPRAERAAVDAARRLETWGVAAITSDCGLMLRHQAAVARAVDVPVGLSSMLLLPLALATCGGRVGIVAANAGNVTPDVLALAGVQGAAAGRVVVAGMQGEPCFASGVLAEAGSLDIDAIRGEVVAVACRLVDEHPDVAALLFDCVDLPPHAHAVAAATGRPVFDHVALVEHLQRVTHPPLPRPERAAARLTRDRAALSGVG